MSILTSTAKAATAAVASTKVMALSKEALNMFFPAINKVAARIVLAGVILAGPSGAITVAQDRQPAAGAPAAGTRLPTLDQAPLGSPDFYPSPERPVGWRGDGSGRFPGATPPTVWSRRLADITSEIMVQAVKPKGKPGPGSHVLEYFTVKDWLVAGPFPADNPEKDIDHDFLGGEAEVQPDAGAKAGDKQWKTHRADEGSQSYHACNSYTCTHLWIDFLYAFGTLVPPEKPGPDVYADLDHQTAYAHTYLYSPRQADVDFEIPHNLPALKMWVNGTPQRVDATKKSTPVKPIKIHLNEGWNRLLIKAICDKSQEKDGYGQFRTNWRFAAYIKPAGSSPIYSGGYETKNITWMIKLTGRNCSQPIVVGDKLFVGSGDTDLFCLDKKSGKILWMHTGTYWDAMTAEERAAVKDQAEPLLKELDKSNAELISLLNASITPQGLESSRQAVMDKKLGERKKFLKSLHDALSTGQKGKLCLNEVSAGNATPTSDGKQVYWVVQGSGGYLSSAFDLNGKLNWSSFEYQKDAGEHGSHRSPLLCGGKLLVSTNEKLIAYDTATGKELWRGPGSPHQHGTDGGPIVVQFNGRRALQTTNYLFSLDGEVLAKGGYTTWGCYIPVVEDGVLYNPRNSRLDCSFEAFAIPKQDSDKHKGIWKMDRKTLGVDGFYVASPLYLDGLVYQVDTTGHLAVINTRGKKLAYQHWLDGYNFNDRALYGYCASPALAGKNIYLMDGVGYVTILKPGSEFAVVGNNVLQNLTGLPASAPGKQEVFYAGMYFDGQRMFLHGDEYLYGIEEK